ncbi:Eco57I restriction-modification methylase domain-containing protein [Polyangium spumosum]|uniref:site-specific DNA-methyltransferase (adenine-specific) n=1 Tax=Polyangium spumosum TaxID=889282 RepID=A0A6N7PWV2_9BACT|nr:Eco57I restriction-modification methylase domain-containing protein [Polyangium spumosum]MRG96712.1 N-6 DNA methylase [Polyangium spumosum]
MNAARRLHAELRDLRIRLHRDLCRRHPDRAPTDLLRSTQTLLDRALFIAFAEERGLSPEDTLESELFAPNEDIDGLDVTDVMRAELAKLAAYEHRKDVSVEDLGHVFERSIADLEELRGHRGPSRRKTEGVFYTPAFLARFLVEETLGRVFEERWQVALAAHGPEARRAYREDLRTIRVLDLSCGAGAFLLAAFEAFAREYERVNAGLDVAETVLHENLFGVDVSAESVEITKLSLWLKTAARGRRLTCLDENIRWGNSIITDGRVDPRAFDWSARFREGFDVVIGNPPYVRHELLTRYKEHLSATYRAHHGMADLFVYFFERGISVLKPGGRLGFIVANKWLRAGYAEPLRRLLATETRLESIVDFGHAPIFPDADAFPCVVTLAKPEGPAPSALHDVHVTMFPREELSASAVPEYVRQHRYPVPQSRFDAAPWSLEPPALQALMAKLRSAGAPLTEFAGTKPYYGIKTGCNEAFVVDPSTRDALLRADPHCGELMKPFLRGQDIDRWVATPSNLWMLYIPWDLDIRRFPSVLRHLEGHRDTLEGRPEVKAGRFPWFALSRYAADYAHLFAVPKICYADLAWRSEFCLDERGTFLSDLCFMIPTKDPWVLAVLNAPLLWAYLWRNVVHGKDEVLRLKSMYMESIPIATPPRAARDEAEPAVARLIESTKESHHARAAVLDSLRSQFAVAEPGNKLSDFASLDADAFVQEVLKRRPKAAGKLRAAEMKALREMYADEALPMRERRREALGLERRLSALVNEAYGLTAEEVALLWKTAPPRMPFGPG